MNANADEKPHLTLAKSDYKAYEPAIAGKIFMLDFRFTGGSYLMSYAHLGVAHIQFSNKGDLVTLYTLKGRITLAGHNLLPLRDKLQEHDLKYVQEFDPLRHETPEEGAAIIERIDMPDAKPESVAQGKDAV